MTVNATGCAPRHLVGPALDTRPWTITGGNSLRSHSADETLSQDLAPVWSVTGGRAAAGGLAVGDSVIAFQGVHRQFALFWRDNGQRVWRKTLPSGGATGPLIAGETVVTATSGAEGKVFVFRIEDGRKVWDRQIGPVVGPIAMNDSSVFAGTENGLLVAMAREGEGEREGEGGNVRWQRTFSHAITSGPAVVGNQLVVATHERLYLLDSESGTIQDSVTVPGALTTTPAITDDLIIYSSPDGFIVGFDRTNLAVVWSIEVAEPIFGGAVVARDSVFAATVSGKVWVAPIRNPDAASFVDLETPVRSSPAPISGGLLIATVGGELLLITASSAEPTWHLRVDGPIEQQPIVDRGELIFVDGRGKIHKWR